MNDNLNTAKRVICPTCEQVVPVYRDLDDQEMCDNCGENIGWTFAKEWEQVFDTFYAGDIPEMFQVEG